MLNQTVLVGRIPVSTYVIELQPIYDTLEKANNKANELVTTGLSDNNWVLDPDTSIENDNIARFFWKKVENWNCYYEIEVINMEVK